MIKKNITSSFFSNLILIPTGIGIKNFILIKNSVFDNVSKKHFHKYALYKYFFQKTKKQFLPSTPFIIHNHWSAGYHHWITEALVRLINVNNYQTKLLLIPDNYPTYAFDSLKMLGVNNIQTISSAENLKLNSLEIPENPNSGFYFKEHLFKLKSLLIKNVHTINKPYIYITRKNELKRKIENEDEIIPMLKQYNFEIIDSSLLTFQQQVELFSQCKILISIHGAGLTNVLFMDKQTQLIEFYKKNTFINHCYENMCEALEINFQRILCSGGKNNKTHVNLTDLLVDKNELELLLKNIIR